jgi:hypothetical protein
MNPTAIEQVTGPVESGDIVAAIETLARGGAFRY